MRLFCEPDLLVNQNKHAEKNHSFVNETDSVADLTQRLNEVMKGSLTVNKNVNVVLFTTQIYFMTSENGSYFIWTTLMVLLCSF